MIKTKNKLFILPIMCHRPFGTIINLVLIEIKELTFRIYPEGDRL